MQTSVGLTIGKIEVVSTCMYKGRSRSRRGGIGVEGEGVGVGGEGVGVGGEGVGVGGEGGEGGDCVEVSPTFLSPTFHYVKHVPGEAMLWGLHTRSV